MASEVRVGDKFVIEVDMVDYTPARGYRYYIKGFSTLVFDDNGIKRLEKYEKPKELPHNCDHCVYKNVSRECFPCSLCDKSDIEPRDMFVYGKAIEINGEK